MENSHSKGMLTKLQEIVYSIYQGYTNVIDYTIGGSIGLRHGLQLYWEHLKAEEWIKLVDGVFGTTLNVLWGAVLLRLIHLYIFPPNKEKK